MPTLRGIEDRVVVTARGNALGRVSHVLFHPSEPRVVGLAIQPPPLAYFIERKPRYVRLDTLGITQDAVTVSDAKGAFGSSAEKELGFTWDESVIWLGMPVHEVDGEDVGFIGDGDWSDRDGVLRALLLSRGIAEDAAVGTREIPRQRIKGFDGERVLIERVRDIEFEGGAAAKAGQGAALAGAAAGKAARKAATTAKAAGKAAVKVAKESETGRKALGTLRSLGKKAIDAMGADDDD